MIICILWLYVSFKPLNNITFVSHLTEYKNVVHYSSLVYNLLEGRYYHLWGTDMWEWSCEGDHGKWNDDCTTCNNCFSPHWRPHTLWWPSDNLYPDTRHSLNDDHCYWFGSTTSPHNVPPVATLTDHHVEPSWGPVQLTCNHWTSQ